MVETASGRFCHIIEYKDEVMRMFWDILGIAPTKDRKEITNAYRSKLVDTNPEDKPEEFKALREAYQAALEYAEDDVVKEKSPVDEWADRLAENYRVLSKRIDVEAWKKLFDEDVCRTIDTKGEVEDRLLRFLMEKYNLPHRIWVYLIEEFGWLDRGEELAGKYPPDFVDYLLKNYDVYTYDTLPYEWFEPGINGDEADEFLRAFNRYPRTGDQEERKVLREKMLSFTEWHPYGEFITFTDRMYNGDQEAFAKALELTERYNYDGWMAIGLSNFLRDLGMHEEAVDFNEKAMADHQDNCYLGMNLAKAYGEVGRFEDAIDLLGKLNRVAVGDAMLRNNLYEVRREVNQKMIDAYDENDPKWQDKDLKLLLAWAYLQNDRDEEAYRIACTLKEEETDPFDYYNLMASSSFGVKKYEDCQIYIDKLIAYIRKMIEDKVEGKEAQTCRLGEMINRKGVYLSTMGKEDEAMQTYREALACGQDEADTLHVLISGLIRRRELDEAYEMAQRLISLNPQVHDGHLYMAQILFEMGDDGNAYQAVNNALDLNRSDLSSYMMQFRILWRNNAPQPCKDILDLCDNSGLQDHVDIRTMKAMYKSRYEEGGEQEARDIYEGVIADLEKDTPSFMGAEAYYRYLLMTVGNGYNIRKDDEREKVLEYIDKGLKLEPRHYGLLDIKGWIYEQLEEKEKMLEVYHELEKYEYHPLSVEVALGKYYYFENLDRNAERALYYLMAAYEGGRRSEDIVFYLTYLLTYMYKLDEAEKFAALLKEMEEENPDSDRLDSYNRLGYLAEKRKQYDLALEYNDKVIENAKAANKDPFKYYRHKLILLRKKGDMKEAVKLIDLMRKINKDYNPDYDLRDVYMQSGEFDKAQKLVTKHIREDYSMYMQIRLDVLKRDLKKARAHYAQFRTKTNEANRINMARVLYLAEGDYEKLVDEELKALETASATNEDITQALIYVGEAYAHLGDRKNKIIYGKQALEEYEKEFTKYSSDLAINVLKKARACALVEDYEQCKKLIDEAENYTCSFCVSGKCKDADIFRVFMLADMGRYDEARALAEKGMKEFPDEEDFMSLLTWIERKEKE